ncbi:MAG: GlcNAc-transferase family protein [Congregibacter sp.]
MKPQIFVAIASYADPELPRTLRDCLGMAAKPELLSFGICAQQDPHSPIDLSEFSSDSRFRIISKSVAESRGGPWARNLTQSLWRGEPYTLQVDAHMKFEPAWDKKLIDMLEALPSEKPVITMNAPLFYYDEQGELQRRFDMGVPTTRVNGWSAEFGWAPWFDFGPANTKRQGHTRVINGNFAFSRGQWNIEVPQDPEHYYWGEEFSITVRSFTCGYDLFLPSEVVAWHMLHREAPPRRHWEHGDDVIRRRNAVAFDRLHRLIYSDASHTLGPYGLGTKRSLQDYAIYAGFDFVAKRAHPDVFTGKSPDPVTIHSPEDWEKCITPKEAESMLRASLG